MITEQTLERVRHVMNARRMRWVSDADLRAILEAAQLDRPSVVKLGPDSLRNYPPPCLVCADPVGDPGVGKWVHLLVSKDYDHDAALPDPEGTSIRHDLG